MKYIFQIPILLLMLWASGVSYAGHSVAFVGGDIEAYVTKACSTSDPSGAIDLVIRGGTGPYEVIYKDRSGKQLAQRREATSTAGLAVNVLDNDAITPELRSQVQLVALACSLPPLGVGCAYV